MPSTTLTYCNTVSSSTTTTQRLPVPPCLCSRVACTLHFETCHVRVGAEHISALTRQVMDIFSGGCYLGSKRRNSLQISLLFGCTSAWISRLDFVFYPGVMLGLNIGFIGSVSYLNHNYQYACVPQLPRCWYVCVPQTQLFVFVCTLAAPLSVSISNASWIPFFYTINTKWQLGANPYETFFFSKKYWVFVAPPFLHFSHF